MTDAPSEFWATFSITEGWVECDGIRHEGRGGWFVEPLCKLLVAAGHADGMLHFREATSGRRHFWIKSIHRAAFDERRTREEHFEAVKAAAAMRAEDRAKVPVEKIAAPRSGRQVTVPIDDRILFVEVGAELVRVTPKQREAFAIIRNSPKTWQIVHAKTRNWLVREKWVAVRNDVPTLTELGQQIDQATLLAVANAV